MVNPAMFASLIRLFSNCKKLLNFQPYKKEILAMNRTVKNASVVLGLGTIGYWMYQEFKKSNHTVSGTVRVMGGDIRTGYGSFRQEAKRAFSALRAGIQDWRMERLTDPSLSTGSNRSSRGNGGTPKAKSSSSMHSTETREPSTL
jgi:hypothetical protein